MFADSPALDSFDQYLRDVERYPLIENPKTEREIAQKARAGDRQAAERLVTANLRFVISYVKKYQGRGLTLAELVCIGNEGLLKAVKKFDPDRSVKFISYAVWWIRQTALQALAEQTRSVRLPQNAGRSSRSHGRPVCREAGARTPDEMVPREALFREANLVIAHLHERRRVLDRALAAARRRGRYSEFGEITPAYLATEGRLARLERDLEGANRALTGYLFLRSDPDALVRPQFERVMQELASVTKARRLGR